jgi:hypothetical protein
MRTILFCIFVSSLCLPTSVSAQPITPEEAQIELARRQAPVETMDTQAWCFEWRQWRGEHCFTLNTFVEHMLEADRLHAELLRDGEHEWAEHYQAMFDEARDRGVQGWCERRRQDQFDIGNTRDLSCRAVNEVFVVTYQNQDNQTRSFEATSNIRQAWSWIQRLQESSRDAGSYRNIQLTRLIYSPQSR